MDNQDYFNLINYKKQYEKNKYNFELDANKILYSGLLCKNYYNEITKETVEFICPKPYIFNYNKECYGKYICELKFDFDTNTNTNTNTNTELNIFIIKIENKLISKYNFDQIKTTFPNLYLEINLFCKTNIIIHDMYNSLKKLSNKIALDKKYLTDNYSTDKNNFATLLYRYYYINIDKFISIDNTKSYRDFYYSLCKKYNLEQNNFELDYLQSYFETSMLLYPDYNVIYDDDNNILSFFNTKYTLKINHYPKRYVNCYQPHYIVYLTEKNNLNNIVEINYNKFDSDRNLDKYFTNIIDFITETVNEIILKN